MHGLETRYVYQCGTKLYPPTPNATMYLHNVHMTHSSSPIGHNIKRLPDHYDNCGRTFVKSIPGADGEQLGVRGGRCDPVVPELITIILKPPNPETALNGQEPQELQEPKPEVPLEGLSFLHHLLVPGPQKETLTAPKVSNTSLYRPCNFN